jgi:hypothetical protein
VSLVQKTLERIVGAIERAEENVQNTVRAGLAETTGAVRLTGARVLPIYPNSLAWGGQGRLVGWSVRGTTPDGSETTITVHDGRDDSAPILATVTVAAGKAATVWLGPGGVTITEACFVKVTGSLAGSLYLGAVD